MGIVCATIGYCVRYIVFRLHDNKGMLFKVQSVTDMTISMLLEDEYLGNVKNYSEQGSF